MDSIAKRLRRKAYLDYERTLSETLERVRVYDLQKKILSLWIERGILREGKIDKGLVIPYFLKLRLGSVDRLHIEVPFFTEEIEERFNLEFHSTSLAEDSVRYDYNPINEFTCSLSIFFFPHKNGKCRIIQEEVEKTVRDFKTRVVCM